MKSRALCGVFLASTPWFIATFGLALHASLGRPIWFDEFLHFALAAEPSTVDAWRVVSGTLKNINHGQTGVYMMLNYWTLAVTGPSELALRLPSLATGALLLGSSLFLFRTLGFGILWQIIVVLALLGQHSLMYFAGEARPYMPLAATTAAMLAYYVARPYYSRGIGLEIFGVFVAITGVLMHPYFAVYWPTVLLVAWGHHVIGGRFAPNLKSLFYFANPLLVAGGGAVFVGLGLTTWLVGRPQFTFDPFQWIGPVGVILSFTSYSHTQFLAESYGLAAAFTLIILIGLFPWGGLRSRLRNVIAPAALVAASLALSIFLGWLSYQANYWILGRQWVASVGLVAIGVVWFWAETARIWRQVSSWLALVAGAGALFIVQIQAMNDYATRTERIRAWLAQPPSVSAGQVCLVEPLPEFRAMSAQETMDYFVELANRNIRCGGPIWPEIREYYLMSGSWKPPEIPSP